MREQDIDLTQMMLAGILLGIMVASFFVWISGVVAENQELKSGVVEQPRPQPGPMPEARE